MTLTIGLIGCGRWGTIHHATLMSLKQEGYLDRLVVCDIDATARDAVEADAHYASIDAMLTSEQLDGVAIVTPAACSVVGWLVAIASGSGAGAPSRRSLCG